MEFRYLIGLNQMRALAAQACAATIALAIAFGPQLFFKTVALTLAQVF